MNDNGTARQMAQGPRRNNRQPQPAPEVQTTPLDLTPDTTETTSAPARRSAFDYLMSAHPATSIQFKMNVRPAGEPWSDGTISQTVADCVIPTVDPLTGHETGIEFRGSRIVKKTKSGRSWFELQPPSTGSGFRSPVINSDEEHAKDGLNRWRRAVGDQFVTWRLAAVKAAKEAGKETVVVSDPGVAADASLLQDLGL